MNIYFAGSIRGGRDDQLLYQQIIQMLGTYGTVLTEHFGQKTLTPIHGTGSDVEAIYKQDMNWISEADIIVAEVTQPSLGVGYEIAKAEAMNKPILCLYRPSKERTLSAMIAGNKSLQVENYSTIADLREIFAVFMRKHVQSTV